MRSIVLVVHNVRSAHNVGSILRTADGLGIEKVYLTGYTPYPPGPNDQRLPHLAQKAGRQIQKTALGAETTVPWERTANVLALINDLKSSGYDIAALEQTEKATALNCYKPVKNAALIVGSEIGGLQKRILDRADRHLEIPMQGKKESFNVAVAAAIALYHLSAANAV
ncbi:TrmH family RNA methyltransferase [Candidatus Saccharibacteria bacterium]|nr:TrmH family RNA methyltransferase [Candidatus Saccharibacteria bacterium]